MAQVTVRCGNDSCSTRPILDEAPDLPVEARLPCPVCGSMDRFVDLSDMDSAVAVDAVLQSTVRISATAEVTPGSASTATLAEVAQAVGNAADVTVQDPSPPKTDVLLPDGLVTHEVLIRFCLLGEEEDPYTILEVVDARTGRILFQGADDTPTVPFDNARPYMLPPGSTAREVWEPGPPLPDDL